MRSDRDKRKHVRVVLHPSAQHLSSNEDSIEPVIFKKLVTLCKRNKTG